MGVLPEKLMWQISVRHYMGSIVASTSVCPVKSTLKGANTASECTASSQCRLFYMIVKNYYHRRTSCWLQVEEDFIAVHISIPDLFINTEDLMPIAQI